MVWAGYDFLKSFLIRRNVKVAENRNQREYRNEQAIALCPSVCLSVTSRSSVETAERIELVCGM